MFGDTWRFRAAVTAAVSVLCLLATMVVGHSDDRPPRRLARDGDVAARPFDRGIVVPQPIPMPSRFASGAAAAPPPSPGLEIARTYYDYQSTQSMARLVGRIAGGEVVHFVWMQGEYAPFSGDLIRFVNYAAYSIAGDSLLDLGYNGVHLGPDDSRRGYPDLAMDSQNRAHVSLHSRIEISFPYAPMHLFLPTPGTAAYDSVALGGWGPSCFEVLWPRIGLNPGGSGGDVVHVIAIDDLNECTRGLIWYWRYDGTAWQGPVVIDSTEVLSYQVVADHNSSKCAILLNPLGGPNPLLYNVAYYESQTTGAGWISGAELGTANKQFITNYTNSNGPQAWPDMSAAYDHDGNLHVIYLEQRLANNSPDLAIKHWDDLSGAIHTALQANWGINSGASAFQLPLANVSLGIGDGSTPCAGGSSTNRNYLYVTYSTFAGPTLADLDDISANGYWNGELYLTASADGGASWSMPQNLTNTKTPNCNPSSGYPDSVCRSEVFASIGENVSDIDIFYTSDLDAGSAVHLEGTWQPNPMMYLRFPGGTTDAPYLCAPYQAQFAASLDTAGGCGYHSMPGKTDTTTLHLSNTGNGPLLGRIQITYPGGDQCAEPWLEVGGHADTLSYAIPPGTLDYPLEVIMHGDTLPGMLPAQCTAVLQITHNDASQTSPQTITIPFSISPCYCHADPQCDQAPDVLDVILTIGVAFRGEPAVANGQCPFERTDVDCSGASDVLDVVHMTNVAFRVQDAATEFCHPCQ